jgi:hypothetical protein
VTKAPEPPSRRPIRAQAATAGRNHNTIVPQVGIPRSGDAGSPNPGKLGARLASERRLQERDAGARSDRPSADRLLGG